MDTCCMMNRQPYYIQTVVQPLTFDIFWWNPHILINITHTILTVCHFKVVGIHASSKEMQKSLLMLVFWTVAPSGLQP